MIQTTTPYITTNQHKGKQGNAENYKLEKQPKKAGIFSTKY